MMFLTHLLHIAVLRTGSGCVREVWLGLELWFLLMQGATWRPLVVGV